MKFAFHALSTIAFFGFGVIGDMVQFLPEGAAHERYCTPAAHYVVSGGEVLVGDHVCTHESLGTWVIILLSWIFTGSVINGKLLFFILSSEDEEVD